MDTIRLLLIVPFRSLSLFRFAALFLFLLFFLRPKQKFLREFLFAINRPPHKAELGMADRSYLQGLTEFTRGRRTGTTFTCDPQRWVAKKILPIFFLPSFARRVVGRLVSKRRTNRNDGSGSLPSFFRPSLSFFRYRSFTFDP